MLLTIQVASKGHTILVVMPKEPWALHSASTAGSVACGCVCWIWERIVFDFAWFQSAMNYWTSDKRWPKKKHWDRIASVWTTIETGVHVTACANLGCNSDTTLVSNLRNHSILNPNDMGQFLVSSVSIPHWFLDFVHSLEANDSARRIVSSAGGWSKGSWEAMLSTCRAHMWPPCHQPCLIDGISPSQ